MNETTLPLPAAELIPHRQTMLLVDKLIAYDRSNGSGCIQAGAKDGSIFCDRAGKFLEEVVVLEMMAQAYACLRGYEERLAGCQPTLGFLVGVRHFNLQHRVEVSADLTIEVATKIQVDDFFLADAAVLVAAEKIATAELKIWVPPAAES
jgi:predicted hotdog family 3-hydroxylacyl-ACP dehydratase